MKNLTKTRCTPIVAYICGAVRCGAVRCNPKDGSARRSAAVIQLTDQIAPPYPPRAKPIFAPHLSLQAAAGASRPASVSSLATALAVLCAFTVAEAVAVGECGGEVYDGHQKAAEDAFTCLIGVAEMVPENSAQAECVKAALVSLKECAEVGRTS